jgi:hypothetical protein
MYYQFECLWCQCFHLLPVTKNQMHFFGIQLFQWSFICFFYILCASSVRAANFLKLVPCGQTSSTANNVSKPHSLWRAFLLLWLIMSYLTIYQLIDYCIFLLFMLLVHESKPFNLCQVSMGRGLLIPSYSADNTASLPSGAEVGMCTWTLTFIQYHS